MKTVCKKLLCLMLVAMMLVSAVPFAFATEGETALFWIEVRVNGESKDSKQVTMPVNPDGGTVLAYAKLDDVWGSYFTKYADHEVKIEELAPTSAAVNFVTEENKPDDGFNAWHSSAVKLRADHPQWTGMGKLVFDTQLMIDAMAADSRVDESRIGIAGHSLGGKMAMYTGCLDERIKVILASDLGIGWDQTNWNDIWYWGEKVDALKMAGLEHSSLLSAAAPKPFMLLAGEFDNEDSRAMMNRAAGYEGHEDNLQIINHATGHRPPTDVLEKGYDFLDKWLKD